jgi:hypothetical protein
MPATAGSVGLSGGCPPAEMRLEPEQAAFHHSDDLVGEVLPNGNVLGALLTTDNVVSPLDARRVVLG